MRLAAAAVGVALLIGGSACGDEGESADEPGQLTRVVLEPTSKSTTEQLDVSAEIMRARLVDLGVSGPSVKPREGMIELIVPGTGEREVRVVTRRGLLEFFDLQGDLAKVSLDAWGNPVASRKALEERPGTILVTCGKTERYCPGVEPDQLHRTYYYLFNYDPENEEKPVPELTGDDLKGTGTRQDFDSGPGRGNEPVVVIQFTDSGAEKFEEITRTLAERGRVRANGLGLTDAMENDVANQQFAIVLDRSIKSAPTVDFDDNPSGIGGNNGAIITGFSMQEARDLALVLRAGALPLEFRVVSKETRAR